jgi:hypothetical protein
MEDETHWPAYRGRRNAQKRGDIAFLVAAAAYIYFRIFSLRATPIYLTGDHEIFLQEAQRILLGDLPFREFVPVLISVTSYVYAACLRIFGLRMWVPNAVLLLLGFILNWLCLRISRSVLPGMWRFAPPLLFVTLGFNTLASGTHHWFSVLASVAALNVVLEKRTALGLCVAGALCGVASAFTPTRGELAAAAIAA